LTKKSKVTEGLKHPRKGIEYLILGKEKYHTLYAERSNAVISEESPSAPKISTVILNWNRKHLLKKTLDSYLETVTVPYELIIVDNASTDGSKEIIDNICKKDSRYKGIFLTQNCGGEAINLGLELAKGDFLHVSENDLEYLPGWDVELLSKFETFEELGQISVFSPKPQKNKGEIWENHPAKALSKNGKTIHLAETIGTSSMFRRQIWDKGVKWKSLQKTETNILLPDDANFSRNVKKNGYIVSWNDKYVVVNWGHNVKELIENLEYYLSNYKSKKAYGIKSMKKRLLENGYDLIEDSSGNFKIIKKE